MKKKNYKKGNGNVFVRGSNLKGELGIENGAKETKEFTFLLNNKNLETICCNKYNTFLVEGKTIFKKII